jgi:transposase
MAQFCRLGVDRDVRAFSAQLESGRIPKELSMSESDGIDSISGGTMPKPYSRDLRERVIESIEAGASRREAAELYGISPSVVVIWVQRCKATGGIAAKPSGGSVSPLEDHAKFLLGLVTEQPDLTLDEIVAAMSKARIAGSRTAVWRFYERHDFSFKKKLCTRRSKSVPRWPMRADVGCESRACLIPRNWCLSTRHAPAPRWCGCEAAVRAASD